MTKRMSSLLIAQLMIVVVVVSIAPTSCLYTASRVAAGASDGGSAELERGLRLTTGRKGPAVKMRGEQRPCVCQ